LSLLLWILLQVLRGKIKCQAFTARLARLFRSSAQELLNSTPQLFVRDRRARRAGRAAWPRRFADGRGRLGRVGAGHDIFSADEFSERDDAISYQFRVLDESGGVADNTRNQDLPGGEFHVAPHFEPDQQRKRNVGDLRVSLQELRD
jgi:hypothetical protein